MEKKTLYIILVVLLFICSIQAFFVGIQIPTPFGSIKGESLINQLILTGGMAGGCWSCCKGENEKHFEILPEVLVIGYCSESWGTTCGGDDCN